MRIRLTLDISRHKCPEPDYYVDASSSNTELAVGFCVPTDEWEEDDPDLSDPDVRDYLRNTAKSRLL